MLRLPDRTLSAKVLNANQVYVIGALPLRNLSRLWGYLNSFELPVWFRPTGFRLYSYIFGVNINEAEHELTHYKSLGDFFYRRLKPGARPIDDAILVSFYSLKLTLFLKRRARSHPLMEKSCTSGLLRDPEWSKSKD